MQICRICIFLHTICFVSCTNETGSAVAISDEKNIPTKGDDQETTITIDVQPLTCSRYLFGKIRSAAIKSSPIKITM